MNDDEKPLDETMLNSLKEDEQPPESLERRVVDELKSLGLIRTGSAGKNLFLWKYIAAAVVLVSLFAAGFWAGRHSAGTAASSPRQNLFALFLYQEPGSFQSSANRVEEYSQWIGGLRSRGRFAGGEKLNKQGGTVRLDNGNVLIHPHPLTSPSLVLSGYFLLEATSYEEAMQIAVQCPHLKYGGVVEVRPIDPT